MHPPFKKKCTACKIWKEASKENFYINTSNGRRMSREGIPYYRSTCKECMKKRAKKRNIEGRRKATDEERERAKKAKAARRSAYQKLAKKHEPEFQLIYAQELLARGIRLSRYKGIQIKDPQKKKSA